MTEASSPPAAARVIGRALALSSRLPPGLVRRVRPYLPPRAWEAVMRRTGWLRGPLDPSPLDELERVPRDHLLDPAFVTDLLPRLGLSAHGYVVYPPELMPHVGQGVQHFQYPAQFGPFLAHVAGSDVRSYLEIGVEHGGTFAIIVEVLRRFALERALAVDLGPRPPVLTRWDRPGVRFLASNSQTSAFRARVRAEGPWDLVFIDGDHSEQGVRYDVETALGHARMIALHDIAEPFFPDVPRVWRELRDTHAATHDFLEFTGTYPHAGPRLGIGLMTRIAASGEREQR